MKKFFFLTYFVSLSILVKSQTADFTYATANGLFCNPSTIQFTEIASGSPKGFVWSFGNGTGSNSSNPSITYNKAGSYTVKLIVIYANTTVVVTKTIVINPTPTAIIGYDRNYICKPGIINFTAGGSGSISQYEWDFGDGTRSQVAGTNAIAHSFSTLGEYDVTLKATSATGCFDTTSSKISVKTIPITGTVSPTTGCVPTNVSFVANATVPDGSTATNYSWDFGDGSPIVSTINENTGHLYNTPGSYSQKVTITNSDGCINTYNFNGGAYGTPPINSIAYPRKSTICGSDTAVLIARATNANSYYWNFGDGTSATVTDTIAKHKYATLGMKSITVTPLFNGCSGRNVTFQINVIGVIARYNYTNSCADKKTFSFSNGSQGNPSTFEWDFGDSSMVINMIKATHTFPSSGRFVIRLTITDSGTGCSDSYSQPVYTSNPSLENLDSSICKNNSTTFSIKNDYINPLATYMWNVVGNQIGPLEDSFLTIKTTLFGTFNNYVVIDNGSGHCLDTILLNHSILVKGPALNFTTPSSLCLNDLYAVTNSSKPYIPKDSVALWYWNFGVGESNDTIYQPPPYIYANPGTYKIKLTGVDINGCNDSLVKTVVIHPLPFLYIIPNVDTLCSGTTDSLLAFHSDSLTWSPNISLSCASCDTVLTNPSSNIQYFATAKSKFGCTTTDSIMVKVYAPFTASPQAADPYICLNDAIQLNVSPPGKKILWSPATGLSYTNNYNPSVSPSQTTTYTATLTDSVGCFISTTDITVHVKSRPTVDAGPDQSYPYNSPFSINPTYSSNITSYTWTPGNLLNCSSCPAPSGVVLGSNTFLIKVTSDSGCVAQDSVTIFVECKDAYLLIPNAFTPNGDNLNDYFYPLTRGIKSIVRFSIYDRMGNLVYEAKNFPPNDKTYGWNGRINGADQSTAVFVYYMEAVCDLGEKLYKRGSVVLIR